MAIERIRGAAKRWTFVFLGLLSACAMRPGVEVLAGAGAGDAVALRPATLSDVDDIVRVGAVEFDSSGQLIAFEENNGIRVLDTATRAVVATFSGSSPAWATDGPRLAFWKDTDDGRQLFAWSVEANDERQLTGRKGGFPAEFLRVEQPIVWRSDGRAIAFTAVVASTPPVDRSGEQPLVRHFDRSASHLEAFEGVFRIGNPYVSRAAARSAYLRKGGDPDNLRSKAWVFEVDAGVARRVSPDDTRQVVQDWSNDGRHLLVIDDAGLTESPLGPEHTELTVLETATGAVRVRAATDFIVAKAGFSPDGKKIAATTRENPIDFQVLQIFDMEKNSWSEIPAPGGSSVVDWLWCDAETIHVRVSDVFSDSIWETRIGDNSHRLLPASPTSGALGAFDSRCDGTVVTVISNARSSGKILLHSASRGPTELYHANPRFDSLTLGAQRRLTWSNRFGELVNGVLLLPPGYQEGDTLPLIVNMYPTPARDGLHFGFQSPGQLEASLGYAVFYPGFRSPHGLNAFSRGENYTKKARGAAGVDLMREDLVSGLSYLESLGVADRENICLFGFSNGGYAVNLVLAEGMRFQCAVVWSGHSNLAFNRFWYEPDTWAQLLIDHKAGNETLSDYTALSPIYSSANFETPLLMIVGDGDWFSWLPEMIMQFNALREAGKDVELLRYASEGHTFVSAEARQDVWRRLKVHYSRHLVQK